MSPDLATELQRLNDLLEKGDLQEFKNLTKVLEAHTRALEAHTKALAAHGENLRRHTSAMHYSH